MAKAAFIGRFQPLHEGHIDIIRRMDLNKDVDSILIIIGSKKSCRSAKNPFTFEERVSMFKNMYLKVQKPIEFVGIEDYLYDESRWNEKIYELTKDCKYLYGCNKDSSSYYIKNFPHLKLIEIDPIFYEDDDPIATPINSTECRREIFLEKSIATSFLGQDLGLEGFWENYDRLKIEHDTIEAEKKLFSEYPFKGHLNCCTADNLVIRNYIQEDENSKLQISTKVLLVTRGGKVGNGLLAMPGGHKQDNETFKQCALRELEEETGLTENDLYELFSGYVFDHPLRSQGVSKPTVLLTTELINNSVELKASDDAQDAQWYDLKFIRNNRDKFFDDHWEIITSMLQDHME